MLSSDSSDRDEGNIGVDRLAGAALIFLVGGLSSLIGAGGAGLLGSST